jgi:GH43 family beta-xylosidase
MKVILVLIVFFTIQPLCSYIDKPDEKPFSTADYLMTYTYKNTKGPGGVSNMGDPYVFWDEATSKWYMTGTSNKHDASGKGEITLWSSQDLTSWDTGTTILPIDNIPWRDQSQNAGLWGGEIHKKGDTYYLYYSIWCDTSKVSGTHTPRIGVATCNSVNGTYIDKGEPLFNYGYSAIDNHLFREGDKAYFCFVKDAIDNIVNSQHESHIYIVEMNDDWLSVKDESEAIPLIKPEKTWERQTNTEGWYWAEACWMQKMPNGKYYLFYSCNKFSSHEYAIGYAVSDSPKGPFIKYEKNPWLMTVNEEIAGPGNNSFFYSKDGKEMFTAYHLLATPARPSGNRYLNIDTDGIYIYNSNLENYKTSKINIEFSDGRRITEIPMAVGNGEATIINCNEIITNSIKITIAQKGINQLGMGFSEIMVFGE